MTFLEYVEKLNIFLEKHPEYANLTVIYAKDEEGNSFYKVYNDPVVGFYDKEDKDFIDKDNLKDYGFGLFDINSVCIN